MAAPNVEVGPGRNRLLQLLPPALSTALRTAGQQVDLRYGQTLLRTGEPIEYVYFPDSGVVSLLVVMQDGRGVDAAAVGFEGMVGVPLALGEESSPYEATMQVAGAGLRIATAAFQQTLVGDPAVRDVILRYVGALLVQTTRSAACNRLHPVEARMARWLLHTHDRMGVPRFRLTHDFLATMLGVRRATVTLAANAFQRAGLIAYRRGELTVLDRPGLEAIACEDYLAVREAMDRLLGLPRPAET